MIMTRSIGAIKESFDKWWRRENHDRPLVRIVGFSEGDTPFRAPKDDTERHIGASYRAGATLAAYERATLFGDAFAACEANMGPGSMAAYLGAEPIFAPDTVWYKELVKDDLSELDALVFDENNAWWQRHTREVSEIARLLRGTNVYPTIPDILENIDILSLLRSPQSLCYDLIDDTETVRRYIRAVDDLYYRYYDRMYDLVKDDTGGCAYTAFSILSRRKCIKVQCDFSALMSPRQFDDLILPSLEKQLTRVDDSLYHLDGKDAIRHLKSLMRLGRLCALQWTPGAGQPDGGYEGWYPIYDAVRDAGKGLWIGLDGDVETLIEKSRRLVRRYGCEGMYFLYPGLTLPDAEKLWDAAQANFA